MAINMIDFSNIFKREDRIAVPSISSNYYKNGIFALIKEYSGNIVGAYAIDSEDQKVEAIREGIAVFNTFEILLKTLSKDRLPNSVFLISSSDVVGEKIIEIVKYGAKIIKKIVIVMSYDYISQGTKNSIISICNHTGIEVFIYSAADEWDNVYSNTNAEQMEWFCKQLDPDLEKALTIRDITEGTFLDLGTGPGTQAVELANRGFKVTATDISLVAIEKAKIFSDKVEFLQDDILDSKLQTQFDFILDRGCFHGIDVLNRSIYISQVTKLLKTDGLLFLKCLSKDNPGEVHYNYFSRNEVQNIFDPHFQFEEIIDTIYHGPGERHGIALFAVMKKRKVAMDKYYPNMISSGRKNMLDFDSINVNSITNDGIFDIKKIPAKDMAIIGISVKMPMADTVEEFWNNIRNGVDCIREFPETRRRDVDNYLQYINKKRNEIKYSEWAYLEKIDKFDYGFFRLSPREASLIDPNQRLFLEAAWGAIEDAGYGGEKLKGSKTGVYVGFNSNFSDIYLRFISEIEPHFLSMSVPGNLTPVIASRISYQLDLKGPSMLVDTACSSSLVALHLACQAIRNGECELAITGGIKLNLLPLESNHKFGIESSDARTKAFDDGSDGTGGGEGVAAMLIKPLSKALKDRDNIYAVIKGSAINQDGSSIGITAPNPIAQEDVIVSAWEDAGIEPETITYIEAHGTATALGDPIEIEGIQRAFKRYTDKKQFCAIGSVKTNIGHLNSAAGIAGFIKTVLALKHKELPPSLHFSRPNRKINFKNSPVYVNNMLTEWDVEGFPRRCGVSSFGLSGTNCHVVLEEAPEVIEEDKTGDSELYVLALSAKSQEALIELVKNYKKFTEKEKEWDLADVCYTANTGRGHYNHRLAMVLEDKKDLEKKINKLYGIYKLTGLQLSEEKGVYYGKYTIVPSNVEIREAGEITEEERISLNDAAKRKADEVITNGKYNQKILDEICKLYIKGANVDWDELYKKEDRKRVSLPIYPFEHKRCWLEIPEIAERQELSDEGGFYYTVGWKNEELKYEDKSVKNRCVMILKDETHGYDGIGDKIARKFREEGREVVEVEIGEEYKKVNENKYVVQGNQEDYGRLLADIKLKKLSQILHLSAITERKEVTDINELEETQKRGVNSLFHLSKALLNSDVKEDIDIILVSEYINEVTRKEERINPENATLAGLGKVIGMESFKLKCRCLDIDEFVDIEVIISEMMASYQEYQVAYRNGKRYVEIIDKVNIEDIQRKEIEIKDRGIYIITGGTGGIGLEIGKYLASKQKVKLALINRSKLPEREKWDMILGKGEEIKLCRRIKGIMEIEKSGAEVACYRADVSKVEEMKVLIDELRNKYGRINGIIHCAGIAGDGFIINKEEELFNKVLLPKVHGTWILDRLTREDEMDFFVMFSSLTSVLGESGQGDYTAANAFLDSYSAYRNKTGKKTLTINWSGWEKTGVTVDYEIHNDGIFKLIPKHIAINAFDEVLKKDITNVIIGKINYDNEMLYKNSYLSFKFSYEIRKEVERKRKVKGIKYEDKKESQFIEVKLTGRKNGEYSETEKQVAQVWRKVLGYAEINVYDNFYELGGDSIQAMKIVNCINENKGIKLEITELLRFPTIDRFVSNLEDKYLKMKFEENIYSTIQHAGEREYYPVSSAQKRMFLLNLSENTGINYNMPSIMTVEGNLDKGRLEKAFKDLIKRHETLRTSFGLVNGEPVQRVHKDVDFEIKYLRMEEDKVKDVIKEFIQPFDLNKSPLLRVNLIKLRKQKYMLLFDMHHIVSDRISTGILVKEFIDLYKGKSLPELTIQYKDFSVWQNEFLKTEFIKKQEKYWLNIFSGEIPILNMPTDYTRPLVQSFEGDNVAFRVKKELIDSLNRLASRMEVTMFTVFLAAYNVLLSKYTGQEDIIVSSPMTDRPHTDLENVIGMFVNTFAMRNYPEHYKTFREFLEEVRENSLMAYENQDYQFEELVERLDIRRDFSRNPLFDTMIVFQNVTNKTIEIKELKFVPYEFENKTAQFDLIFEVREDMGFSILYCTKLFKKETIQRMAGHFANILRQIVENPDIKLSEIDMLDMEEKNRILYGFNNTKIEYPKDKAIYELFEEQAEKTPDNIAIKINMDLNNIYEELKSEKINVYMLGIFTRCFFKQNDYTYQYKELLLLDSMTSLDDCEKRELKLLKTHLSNYIAVNESIITFLDYFDGKNDLESVFKATAYMDARYLIYTININSGSANKSEFIIENRFENFMKLIKILYNSNLIELVGFNTGESSINTPNGINKNILLKDNSSSIANNCMNLINEVSLSKSSNNLSECTKSGGRVLLLGDTVGTATVGLLYLASYLRRNGIEAYCQWNDLNDTYDSLKENIKKLLKKVKPDIVGVSMKWFLHIARALEICKIVKEYYSDIKIVVGGNTASYYCDELSRYEFIDYIILGDGELPLLKICEGADYIPNCIYKKDGEIIKTSITYVQDENNSHEIYLSHLDEIFIAKGDPFYASEFFIYTGKGCHMNCFYCAGCKEAQKRIFNRIKPFMRGVGEVRRDLIEAKKYISTFMFDFDLPGYDSMDYYKEIWDGIDLSEHFCLFYFWKLPSAELLKLITKTFKYVYISIDLCSLSERHRMELASVKEVKPQPTDVEILSFFDECDKYKNVKVIITTIAGLPYLNSKDIETSHKMIHHLAEKYLCFKEVVWGRLHAQPGAILTENSNKFGMYSTASTFDDFLYFSELNLKEQRYPDLLKAYYSFIYFNDDVFNLEITKHYMEIDEILEWHIKQKNFKIYKELTYKELNIKANQLARILREKGVKPDNIVGIMAERSVEMIIGMLGILKAGGAYLPIDPGYPEERIEYMLKDSNTNILLTQCQLKEKIKFNGEMICIQEDLYCGEGTNLDKVSNSDSLAYIIYTSGTTGKPKGVMVEHRNISNTIQWRREEYELSEEDNVLQLFSYSFDGFLTSFFTPITCGSKVLLLNEEDARNPVSIKNYIASERITHFISIPILYHTIVESMEAEEMRTLRLVTLAGEKVTQKTITKSKEKNNDLEIVNEYGPTEGSVAATIQRDLQKETSKIIGKPIANTKIYIMDRNNRLQPIGVAGELCISGIGLARGYLNKDELTAEKFVSNPFMPGERMYRTGDLARWLSDGNIEFLGRIDNQVKIRGFRIELGEIESKLLNYELIKEAVVTAREDVDGNKSLYAYVVSDKNLDVPKLRAYVSKELPEYMIPSYFIQLENLPLTPNGKVDSKALPEHRGSMISEAEYAAPRNEVEEKLANIWQEVLGIERVGIDDSFFTLGGDSIKAIQVASRLQKYGFSIEIRNIFQYPRIDKLSNFVKIADKKISQSKIEGEIGLTPVQKWFFRQKLTDMHHFNQSVMLYRRKGFDEKIVRRVFDKIIEHHDALRMIYKIEGERIIQYNRGLEGELYGLKVIDHVNEANYVEKIEEEADKLQSGINLSEGPLVKVGLFKTIEGDHLLIVIHHLVVDGVSWRIIFEDLVAGYVQAMNNEEIKLPEKTNSFREWSEELQAYSNKKEIIKEIEYWKGIEGTDIAQLPKDYTTEQDRLKNSNNLSMNLSEEDTEKLLNNVSQAYNTEINDILLTALGLAVKEWTGEGRMLVNLEGHGREEIIEGISITRTVGWFTIAYPIILDIGKSDDLSYQIKVVKEGLRHVPNRGIGYGIIKYLMSEEKKETLQFRLKPEINFNYLGQFDRDIETEVFNISPYGTGQVISPNIERQYAFDINGIITGGKLTLTFNYNKSEYNESTVLRLIEGYKKNLQRIIRHCIEREKSELTPTDVGDEEISIEELDKISRLFN